MKKRIFGGLGLTVGFATIAVAAIVTVSSVNARSTESDLLTKNLEALTRYELGNINDACGDYCWNNSFYVCCLYTSAGFTVYCDQMEAWNHF